MKKLLMLIAFGFTALQALNLDEMIHQEYDEITPGECEVSLTKDIEIGVCSLFGAINARGDKLIMITGHFYSSYYKILIEHINTQDKHKIDDMVKNMLAKQDECEEMASNIDLPEGANPIIPSLELYSCMQDEYGKSFQELSNFIYDNPKYKHIFDEIFAPNPKEYYELIKSNSNSEFLLENILQKAAQDNLIDKTGKLIDRVDSK